MRKNVKRGILLLTAIGLALTLAGCGSLPGAVPGPRKDAPVYKNGQVVDIQGRVVLNKNQVTLQDQNSPALFRFVGLKPAEQRALSGLAGKFTRVRLKVISTETPRAYNAQFIQFSTRG